MKSSNFLCELCLISLRALLELFFLTAEGTKFFIKETKLYSFFLNQGGRKEHRANGKLYGNQVLR